MPNLFHPSPSPSCNRYYAWFTALHTRIDLLLLGPQSELDFEQVEEAVRAELDAVERMGNRFEPDSELSRVVREAHSQPVPLSTDLYQLLDRCLRANAETGGLFDITVCSPAFRPGLIRAVHLTPNTDDDGGTLFFQHDAFSQEEATDEPCIVLDLSGILKGYALERLRKLLQQRGIHDALVNLGNSSILSLGNNPSDIPPGHCLTTSGNATPARRHIMNPLTGTYITGQHEVSVTTANAIEGEIQATLKFITSNSHKHKQL